CYILCYEAPLELHSFPTRRSSDLVQRGAAHQVEHHVTKAVPIFLGKIEDLRSTGRALRRLGMMNDRVARQPLDRFLGKEIERRLDRKSTRLNSSHLGISYAVFCLK